MKENEKKKYISQLKKIARLFDETRYKDYCFKLVEEIEKIQTEEIEKTYPLLVPDGIGAFSDGACRGNPGPGSWAYMIQDDKGEILQEYSECFELTTNNKMELSGAIASLEYLLLTGKEKHKIVLFTDSTYVVKGITEWVKGWKERGWKKSDKKAPENLELWKRLDELSLLFADLNFSWVKGHSGHPQNERCDEMANIILDEYGY